MSELPYRFSFEAFCHIVLYCILLTWFSLCRINGRKDQDNLIRLAGGRSTSFQQLPTANNWRNSSRSEDAQNLIRDIKQCIDISFINGWPATYTFCHLVVKKLA